MPLDLFGSPKASAKCERPPEVGGIRGSDVRRSFASEPATNQSALPYAGVERRKLPRAPGFPISNAAFDSIRAVIPAGDNVLDFLAAAVDRETQLRCTLTFRQAAELFRQAGRDSRYLDKMVARLGDMHLGLIDEHFVKQLAVEMYPTQSSATRNRVVLATTQAVINNAVQMRRHKDKLSVRRFKEIRREKAPVDWPWVQAFKAVASPHLGALAVLMFTTGARVSEAVALTWADVELDAGRVLIRQTKIAREGWRDLTPACLDALLAMPGERLPAKRVFGYASRHSAKRPWSTAVRRAGIKFLGFHACRHGFATSMLHAGVDPVTVAALGGWANPVILLKVYAHARRGRGMTNVLTEGGPPPAPATTVGEPRSAQPGAQARSAGGPR